MGAAAAPLPAAEGLAATRAETARLRATFPLVAAGVVASLANLLSTVLVARLLPAVAYGALAKLLGLFLVLSMPGSALMVGVVRRVAAWELAGRVAEVRGWVARVHAAGVGAVVVLALTMLASRGAIAHLLHLQGSSGIVEIVTAGGAWVLVSIDRGLLQARRAYQGLAVNLMVEGTVRTAGMIGLAVAGLGLEGAALGILGGEVAAACHARWRVHGLLGGGKVVPVATGGPGAVLAVGVDGAVGAGAELVTGHSGRDLVADVLTAVASLALLAVLQNADVIVLGVRAPGRAGAYAAISVPAKALVFWALVLANYLLPEATIRHHQGRHALAQLAHTLAVLAPPAAGLLGVAVVAPRWFLSLVFGSTYAAGAGAFWGLVLAMVCLCVTTVLTSYLLGVGWRWIVALLGAGGVGLAAGTVAARGQLVATARADLVVQAALAVVLAVAFGTVHRRSVRAGSRG